MVRDAWRAGNVNTRVKVLKDAVAGREDWRRSSWEERPDGDIFTMGSRAAMQYARCYDRRGFTRFELELKGQTGAAVGPYIMESLAKGTLGELAIGLIQRFVTFVDRSHDSNLGRCPELEWWSAFTDGVKRARLWLGERIVRTLAEVKSWAGRQVAPSLAVIVAVLGWDELHDMVRKGRERWGRRHRDTLRLARAAGYGAAA
jgi:hypothetical protein